MAIWERKETSPALPHWYIINGDHLIYECHMLPNSGRNNQTQDRKKEENRPLLAGDHQLCDSARMAIKDPRQCVLKMPRQKHAPHLCQCNMQPHAKKRRGHRSRSRPTILAAPARLRGSHWIGSQPKVQWQHCYFHPPAQLQWAPSCLDGSASMFIMIKHCVSVQLNGKWVALRCRGWSYQVRAHPEEVIAAGLISVKIQGFNNLKQIE